MMTLEEIKEATAMLEWHTPTVSHKTMAKALASLTEAYAEIERLKERLRPFVCEHNTYHDDPCHETDGMSQENVRVDLHVNHLAPLLALVRASKDSRWQRSGQVLHEMPEATPEMMREIEHRLRLSQIESGKAAVTIRKETK